MSKEFRNLFIKSLNIFAPRIAKALALYRPIEGVEIASTGETGGTKFLREDGDGTCSWQAASGGSGAVSAVANGADNRVATFTSSDALNGEANLTFDGTDLGVSAKIFHIGDTDTYINFTDDDINIQCGGVNFLDFTEDSQNDVTFNEGGVDIDFRIESADESHMFFMEASSNRISIGDNTGSPGATLEVKNNASSGATGVPLVQLNSNDTDQQCLDINAGNITANVVNITANDVTTARVLAIGADGLTTGNALYVDDNSADTGTRKTALIIQNNAAAIAATALAVQSDGGVTGVKLDKNYSDTTAATVTGLNIDWDKTGASTSNNTMYGIKLDMDNTTATNGNNYMYGIHVTPTLTHAADAGGAYVYGLLVEATGGSNGSSLAIAGRFAAHSADTNYGIITDVEDGGVDLRIESSADNGDYFQIQTTTHGATTLSTVDDDATAANLTLDVDGKIIIEAAAGDEVVFNEGSADVDFRVESAAEDEAVFLDASAETLYINKGESAFTTQIHNTNDVAITVNASGVVLNEDGHATNDFRVESDNVAAALAVNAGDDTIMAGGFDSTNHKDGFAVFNDYNVTTFENKLADGQFGSAEILRYSPGADDTLTAGQLYFLHTDGTWNQTDADAVATGASQMLGIGLGNARETGVLIRGFVRIPSSEILNLPGSGACDGLPVYVSTTAGHLDFTAPSASNDFVRVVGYAIDDDSSDVLIYFNPDATHVEIA